VRDCLQSTRAIGMTDVLSPSQVRAFFDCEVRCHGHDLKTATLRGAQIGREVAAVVERLAQEI
jgi:hypothetical protein